MTTTHTTLAHSQQKARIAQMLAELVSIQKALIQANREHASLLRQLGKLEMALPAKSS